MRNFPAPGISDRVTLGQGRWTGITLKPLITWVGVHVEIAVSGRRVIINSNVVQPLSSIGDGGAPPPGQLDGMYCPDPEYRAALWFNAPGNEILAGPAGQQFRKLDGSGIYVSAQGPIDYRVSFERLYFELIAIQANYYPVRFNLNIEEWTEAEGDRV